ncbi:phosphoribosylanthranilate isomerase [Aphanizomenon flos-aquae NRERC-008]|jgi:phosphoribosylanthranilate isomerase|uniref:N-(5'-phosphoribosyl)anthranilate isomerase n=1 Tax=Aphanizomenon flos-aquae FACHB-1249 TaxID=2692889 RepID=A0ABR8ISN2_APHFL|nr:MULTISPECIES: phosphoribosylanthranilate isomerase [Aphanizomenon]MCE2903481.1 phosphoribosylanthranilate isomerase [Anabaena sp. CoA2_C59]MDJ0505523.1 phosphoribosylanthranilate isomerase [Nostocales cyanobacterium LE14-WE12]MBD2391326.1 phosphoribosylanthranilate isomerase [Aphanizomenon flos-aquae FACHB-1171]MBD2557235.1 phosphoribosylanthranilate isomerase [Aphanizomenon flos-aquae FACHB-1290]MBD2632487.1 phosphoribosylanthranilate isomerase [Aphanizomenon sp. FACHB-1399]
MRVKICGITQPQQSLAIASLGATALGFICVPSSPRYVTIAQIQAAIAPLSQNIDKIGVFANTTIAEISQIVTKSGLTGIQLHGEETPEFCQQLRQSLPQVEIIKAIRVRSLEHLQTTTNYTDYVDTLLLDAYHPQQLGGTGQTLNWHKLNQEFSPSLPWFLAGGLTADNILTALSHIKPSGIDLSSGVEHSPGNKDLHKVALLFQKLDTR